MNKKKLVFIINHFQYSDGVSKALLNLVNNVDLSLYEVTIKPIYGLDKEILSEIKEGIVVEKCFGFYFRGLDKIIKLVPKKILYKKIINGKYDVEVAFQCGIPTHLVGYSTNNCAVHVAWMHGYLLYPYEYSKCDKVVCVSKYCADKAIKEMGGNNANIIYKYNIIDDKKIKKMSQQFVNIKFNYPGELKFISVGRHSSEKGYIRLINILAELRDEGYKFNMILVGDGPEHNSIKNSIKKLEMEKYILLVGEDNNPHKYTILSDLFICSSYSEGYSTACTEAAILGVPIITTDVPGGQEIIDECECGILANNDDKSLKESIKYILDNKLIIDKWKEIMKKNCEKFSLENRKKELDDLFNELYCLSNIKKDGVL